MSVHDIYILPAVLSIDQGTHASRATIYSFTGTPLCEAHKNISLNRIDDFRVEQDPLEILESVRVVLHQCMNQLPKGYKIQSIGLATQRSSLVAWNKSGEALSPVISWQDRRTLDTIVDYYPCSKIIKEKTGLPLSPHYGATKLAWLLKNHENVKNEFENGSLMMGPLVSYLLYNLLDVPCNLVDHANASRTLLCNLQTGDWDDDLLNIFGIDKCLLPTVKPILSDYGTCQGIAITAVSGDQNSALFSDGAIPENSALVNLGSGAFVLKPTGKYIEHAKMLSGLTCSDGESISYALEGTVNGCATALDWAKTSLGIFGDIDLDKILDDQHTSDAQNIPIFVNTVGGLGSPWWKSGTTPGWIYPSNNNIAPLETDPKFALIAVIESVLFLIRINIEEIQKSGERIDTLIVSGGLSNSDRLCQKLADVCNLKVYRLNLAEATSRGIAFLAASRPDTWQKCDKTRYKVSPNRDNTIENRYLKFYEIIKTL